MGTGSSRNKKARWKLSRTKSDVLKDEDLGEKRPASTIPTGFNGAAGAQRGLYHHPASGISQQTARKSESANRREASEQRSPKSGGGTLRRQAPNEIMTSGTEELEKTVSKAPEVNEKSPLRDKEKSLHHAATFGSDILIPGAAPPSKVARALKCNIASSSLTTHNLSCIVGSEDTKIHLADRGSECRILPGQTPWALHLSSPISLSRGPPACFHQVMLRI